VVDGNAVVVVVPVVWIGVVVDGNAVVVVVPVVGVGVVVDGNAGVVVVVHLHVLAQFIIIQDTHFPLVQ